MSNAIDLVVGIGASAGGLDAFQSFFNNMPPDTGMVFVVVLHLPANRKSMLPEILRRWTSMPVVEATGVDVMVPNTVYVPPPHAVVSVREGRLYTVSATIDTPRESRPIDAFFDSLGANLRDNAIGIVMSGTGTDGSLGLKVIRECGGFTLAQGSDGTKPLFDGMPHGAIATGAVDLIASVEEMPGHLQRIAASRRNTDGATFPAGLDTEEARKSICTILRNRLGHDFSGYKDKTFLRRVARRMQVLNINALDAYIARLHTDPGEAVLLFRDLLIRVTSFFRDGDTFEAIEREVVPRLFRGRHADSTVRAWVPGCATGEEAYSLAMLFREHMDKMQGAPKVQIFATDIDEPALDTARLGRYPATLLAGLSQERRERFFRPGDTGSVVTKEIRELCTFSAHSVIRDPPFSRMDLISCRNLLIYLDIELQAKVIPALHYSLVPRGILLLGSSETTARHEELFIPLDKPARIFMRRDVRSPQLEFRPSGPRAVMPGLPPLPTPASRQPAGAEPAAGPDERRRPEAEPAGKPGLTGRARLGLRARLQGALRRLYPDIEDYERTAQNLIETRDQLQSISEEHETALEELRSTNEELHSVNEELQSTVEELETSKEEIQSVNEELHTVNSQLSEKVDELDRTNSDLKNVFDSTEVATIFLDRHLIIRSFTAAVGSIYNLIPSDQGRPLTDIVSRLNYHGLRADVDTVLRNLVPLERRVERTDREAHYIMRILPYRAPDSTVSGTLVTFVDVTSIVQAENHQRLLIDELNHRVKNMLTVVISLASQTLRRSGSLEEFSDAFMGRVQALTASYMLLSKKSWIDILLAEVLKEETQPFLDPDRKNIHIEGPSVLLAPHVALALGMAIHELATNAVKFGALSVPHGSVKVSWRFEDDSTQESFVLEWVESGGPPVLPPSKRGFGTSLIERGFAHELSGRASITFAPAGVRVMLSAPVSAGLYRPQAASA